MPRVLTTTSFAILAQLAMRPRTPYELATWMERNLRFFWPRAASRIYHEPKLLLKAGYVTVRKERSGRRPRSVYAITPKGRRAVRAWHRTPPAPPSLEFEGLLRVFFAGLSTPEELRPAIATAKALADDIQRAGRQVATEYMDGQAPFPERVHLSGIAFDFLWHYAELLRAWAERSDVEIGTWSNVEPTGKAERALRVFRGALRADKSQ